jgi:hypothetical protein
MNMRPRASSQLPRHGMALPMVIVVLLVLSASFAGGVALARGERALDDAGKSGVLAQTNAESGLQRIVSDRASLGLSGQPGAADSVRVTFSGGYYDVTTTRLRVAVGTTVPGLYFLRSHAVVTRTGVASGPSAEYTVTELATWMNGTMMVQSALTSVNGTDKAGAAGVISGADQCAVGSGGTNDTLPAVAVPTTAAGGGSGYTGSLSPLVGNPQVQSLGATPAAAAATSPISWPGIYNGTAITADFIVDWQGNPVAPDTLAFPNDAWYTAHPTAFPVILVQNGPPNAGNEFVLSSFGRGMLIVQDDIRLNGNTAGWDGIILVGGRLRTNGSNRVSGATVSGLNTQFTIAPNVCPSASCAPTANDINDLNGTKQFLYNSCNVKSATSAMGKLRVYKNTWSNNYKTF